MALRTQQIIAHETGVANTIDPLGGSYFDKALTDRMEEGAYDYFRRIDELGGMVDAIKQPSRGARSPTRASGSRRRSSGRACDRRRQPLPAAGRRRHRHPQDPGRARAQADRPPPSRPGRQDTALVEQTLASLREAAATDRNLMELLLEAARAHATEGEIVESGLRDLHRDARFLSARRPPGPPGQSIPLQGR